MSNYEIKTNKELMWDMELADVHNNIKLNMHKPVRKNVVLDCNKPWEGVHCGYAQIIYDGEKYRMYYRGSGDSAETEKGTGIARMEATSSHGVWCVAYSYDGKTFTRPNLGNYEFDGSKDNNIVHMESSPVDNFAIMYDTNPNCPPDEKCKALAHHVVRDENELPEGIKMLEWGYQLVLSYYKSADGLKFEFVRHLSVPGAFDSMNLAMWDDKIGKYRLYFRDLHTLDEKYGFEYESEKHVRDVRLSTSEDFVHWTEPKMLDFGEDKYEIQFYTNNIMKYPGTEMFFGMPARYIHRSPDMHNFKYLPDVNGKRAGFFEQNSRSGPVITDTFIMTSRDGLNFNRTNEAFFNPGIENGENWVYGDGFFASGVIETESDFSGEPNELSLYIGTGYRARNVTFERFTIRMDGLFSWGADFEGGEVLTRPFEFKGDTLHINFETSALGYVVVELCDESGTPIEGYNTGRIFGNSTDRPCDFEKPLSELSGKTVRMKISMRDAELYSLKFNK